LNLWRRAQLKLHAVLHDGHIEVAAGARLLGQIRFTGPGLVRIGAGSRLDGRLAGIDLRAGPGAELLLGEGVVVEEGVSIEALQSVEVGARCRLGAFSKILDNNLHLVEGDREAAPDSYPVRLEEDVTLGPRAIILPGAYLGRGTRVRPGAVFSHRSPAGAEVVGHPARIRPPA
jgi:acetyltransferase-like isoleucine patch superfamily enzyme